MKLTLLAIVVVTTNFDLLQAQSNADLAELKTAPFSAVRLQQDTILVEVDSNWYQLVSMDTLKADFLLEQSMNLYGGKYLERLSVDLVELLQDLTIEPHLRESFTLIDRERKKVEIEIEFTKEKRNNAMDFYRENFEEEARAAYWKRGGQNRISRTHENHIPIQFQYLTTRLDGYDSTGTNQWLTPKEALHDLEHLEWQIVNNYSYANLTGFNYSKAIDALIADLRQGISRRDLALQFKMLMANFGDGHSGVSLKEATGNNGSEVPFEVVKHQDNFYAIVPSEHNFAQIDYPQIRAIGGVLIEQMYTVAEHFMAKTTPKFVERNTLKYLSKAEFILKLMGQPVADSVQVTFSNGSNTYEEQVKLDNYRLGDTKVRYYYRDSVLADNIGYLAFNERMDDESEFIDSLHMGMQKLRATDGLVIDIRGNGGGNRAPLVALLPYFIQEPKVTNVARYRSSSEIHPPNGYLKQRYSYFADYPGFTKAEQQAITDFQSTFVPYYTIPDEKFTDYHYMVVSPTTDHGTYYYNRPVIVLIDEGCFSASDIFAAGIRQGDRVKLLGNTTGGGSGFAETRHLPNSGISVRMSRIFSYQPSGATYDGHGVVPDISVDYTLEDKLGRTDSQLEQAMTLLREEGHNFVQENKPDSNDQRD